jgi:hypothetical protein
VVEREGGFFIGQPHLSPTQSGTPRAVDYAGFGFGMRTTAVFVVSHIVTRETSSFIITMYHHPTELWMRLVHRPDKALLCSRASFLYHDSKVCFFSLVLRRKIRRYKKL